MLELDRDRRDAPRVSLNRPCKVFNPRTGKYIAGTTRNVSAGGVSIVLHRPVELEAGDVLHLGIARKRRQALLRSDDMVEVEVVRSLSSTAGDTAVGVRFIGGHPMLELPAFRRAA
jgi:hypothetical protein